MICNEDSIGVVTLTMDHQVFGVKVDISMIWGRVSLNSGLKRKGSRMTNKMNTSEYVADLYQRASDYGVVD